MSYPFNIRFLVGRLLFDNQIEEKVSIVENEPDRIEDDENNEDESGLNGLNEIWSSDELGIAEIEDTMGLLEFKIGANENDFSPEFHIIETDNLRIQNKDFLNKLDRNLNKNNVNYRFLYIISNKTIPSNVVSILTKKVGKTLLEIRLETKKVNDKVFWCILLKPKKIKKQEKERQWSFDESKFYSERLKYDIIGESLSTNCAEIAYTF